MPSFFVMEKISVTIITKNEENNIARCLKSVNWADEIVIVDSGSVDNTLEICKTFKCSIHSIKWLGFGKTKQFAVDQTSHEWVFSIDADEEVTPELKASIQKVLKDNPSLSGFRIHRRSFYVDKWIKHSGWDKDAPLRLFRKSRGGFNSKEVHESIEVKGKIDKLNGIMLHYTYPTVSSHVEKLDRYSELNVTKQYRAGKSYSVGKAVSRGLAKFIKMYCIQKGFLDGQTGFVLALNSAFGVYLKYIKLWEKAKK